MKKIHFLMGALLLASTSLFTSCFCDGDDNSETIPTITVNETEVYSFIYGANVPATFQLVGEPSEGNTVTIIATATDGGDYVEGNTIEKEVTLGDTRIVEVYFEFTKVANTVAVPVGEDVTVYQGEDGSTLSPDYAFEKMIASVGTGVELEMPAEAVENALENGADNAFFVELVLNNDTIEQVSAEEMKTVETETAKKPLETETVAFVCKPDGADFGDALVTLKLTSENAEGVEFYAVPEGSEDATERVEGVSTSEGHQIQVSHFSDWNLILVAKIVNYKENSTTAAGVKDINAGANAINYNSAKSWTIDYPNTLVNAYLEGKLGKPTEQKKNMTLPFTSTEAATVYYTVITTTVEFDLISGTRQTPYHVKANLGSKVRIDKVEPRRHSGGSAQ